MMKMKLFLLLMIAACGSAALAMPKEKVYLKLLQSTTVREQGAEGKATTHFIVIWENFDCPATFFWRGENGWTPCRIEKAHNTGSKKSPTYVTETVTNDAIHSGDTLQLTPVPGGKFRIPAEIPVKAKNTLYFKTGGSNWLAFPVKGKK